MKTLAFSTLQKKSSASASYRGHRIKWGDPYGRAGGPMSRNGVCRCGAEITFHQSPAANQINIGGDAVAVNCPPVYQLRQT